MRITITGPVDVNGQRREFDLPVGAEAIVHVSPEEYRRLAVDYGIPLNDADAGEPTTYADYFERFGT